MTTSSSRTLQKPRSSTNSCQVVRKLDRTPSLLCRLGFSREWLSMALGREQPSTENIIQCCSNEGSNSDKTRWQHDDNRMNQRFNLCLWLRELHLKPCKHEIYTSKLVSWGTAHDWCQKTLVSKVFKEDVKKIIWIYPPKWFPSSHEKFSIWKRNKLSKNNHPSVLI